MEPITNSAPLGRFHARTSRDGESRQRDGAPYFELNWINSNTKAVAEIQFEDGLWLLVGREDLLSL